MTPGRAASQWESVPRSLLLVVLVIVLLAVGAYRFIVPWAARAVAERLPDSVIAQISKSTLDGLEGSVLRPSTLPPDRQREISDAFERLWPADRRGRYRLLFRDSPQMGANAIAPPSGTIVVTDALVRLSRDDREVLGVLAHEVGHVEARHGLRLVAQGAATTLVIGWLVGDFTSVIAVAPSALLHARYSRDFEREADTHAADVLLSRGISPAFLADILERIEANREPAARPAGPIEYLSTHPATRQRLEYLRERTRGAGPSSTVSPSDSAACCLTDLGRSA